MTRLSLLLPPSNESLSSDNWADTTNNTATLAPSTKPIEVRTRKAPKFIPDESSIDQNANFDRDNPDSDNPPPPLPVCGVLSSALTVAVAPLPFLLPPSNYLSM